MTYEQEIREARERFVAYFLATDNKDEWQTKRKIENAAAQIKQLEVEQHELQQRIFKGKKTRKRLGEIRTALIRAEGRVEVLRRSLGSTRFGELHHRLLQIPRVRLVTIQDTSMVISTDTLYGKDYMKHWHRSGTYQITFDLVNRDPQNVRWFNLTDKRNSWQGPPNISENGSVGCLGDAAGPLQDALAAKNWEVAVAIAVRYPECGGEKNQIVLWPEVRDEEVPQWYLDVFGRTGEDGIVPPYPPPKTSDYPGMYGG